jgi:fructuronate reductase
VTAIERRVSHYAPERVGIGIVHIGLGAFHRAHQAAYLEAWLNRNGGGDWGICAANIRSNRTLVEQLNAQGCRYHIAEFADSAHVRITEIASIRRALFAGPDKRALLEQMTAPGTRIVSLSVTEKAYYLNPATGELLVDHADVVHDRANPATPRTAPGLVVEALKRRRAAELAPFTVLSCDNMPDNGRRTRRAIVTLAAEQSAALAEWIETAVACPSSMVDRIVPAVTDETRRRLDTLIGFDDPVAVACEAFSQWVIEDRFPEGRPDWEPDGVEMVADVRSYETMKLRMLNGAHSLLAYLGLQRGRSTVAEAIADPALSALVETFFEEAGATLDRGAGLDTAAYAATLMRRFGNDALEHRLSQVAMDGSQKLPQRWLEAALINLEQGRPISATAEAVAAWMAYVRGKDSSGRTYTVDDPLARKLADCHRRRHTAEDVVDALLGIREIFPERLAERPDFRNAVRRAYVDLTARRSA